MPLPKSEAIKGHNEDGKIAGTSSDVISSRINTQSDYSKAPTCINVLNDCTASSCSIVNPKEMDDTEDERWSKIGMSEDILPIILDNLEILTSKDLLNFRLVNRCWRDAATSILLKRNACDIVLGIGQVAPGSVANPISYSQLLRVRLHEPNNEPNSPTFKYFNARPPHSLLHDLIQIISASLKFPSNSITFLDGYGCEQHLKNLSLSPANENHLLEEDELLKLFSLYGKKIKKISVLMGISISTILKLLYVHLPKVTCLNLGNCAILNSTESGQNDVFHFLPSNFLKSGNRGFKIETLYWGTELFYNGGKRKLLKQLINVSLNFKAIHGAGISALSILFKTKKLHLVKSINFHPCNDSPIVSRLEALCAPSNSLSLLKLCKLTVHFGKTGEYPDLNESATRMLNTMLRGSKDTLEYLELFVSAKKSLGDIQIPSMKKLKYLSLLRQLHHSFRDPLRPREAIDERARLAQENTPFERWVNDLHAFRFENEQSPNRIPSGYFPALSKVLLDVEPFTFNTYHKLYAFFTLEHRQGDDGCIINGDMIPSVTALELTNFPHIDIGLGKLFPNLINLKIQCLPNDMMSNWVWAAFPKLKRFELHDFVPCWETEGHYSFFTVIAHEVCKKFVDTIDTGARLVIGPKQIRFLRTRPYIGDCANLKEIILNCKHKFSSLFLTKLALFYETKCVTHKGKIIFSFRSVDLSGAEIKELQEHMKQVSPYVGIRL